MGADSAGSVRAGATDRESGLVVFTNVCIIALSATITGQKKTAAPIGAAVDFARSFLPRR
jgi:hypothetical protein